jgi:hypothetical protein
LTSFYRLLRPTSNVVVLTEHVRPGQVAALESEPVDLAAWSATAHGGGS